MPTIKASMKKTAKTGTVTDEQGRVRFHGAFTGGFSAGYYNTVGSSEGFQPAQFVSSRNNRASQQSGRSIADYMDEGDGLLGGKLSSVAGIDSFAGVGADGGGQQRALESNSNILNKQLLSELTLQAKPSDTIGKKLLATMGWRLGQGIGPRTQNQKALTVEVHPGADLSKLPKSALLKNGSVTFAPDDEGQKIAFPPPKVDMYGLGFDARLSGRLGMSSEGTDFSVHPDDDDDAYESTSNTYRMSDVIKSGPRGASASASASGSGKRSGYGQQTQQAKRLKYTSGFAYNDEEDDVYSHDKPLALTNSIDVGDEMSQSLVAFDPTSGPEMLQNAQKRKEFAHNAQETLQNINQGVDNWLGGGSSLLDGSRISDFSASEKAKSDLSHTLNSVERCPSDNRPPLAGFHVARRPRVPPPHYPPPAVPEDFHCQHSFTDEEGENSGAAANTTRVGRRQNPLDAAKARSEKMSDNKTETSSAAGASTAGIVGGEGSVVPAEVKKQSIFDLIKPEARLKLQNTINAVNPSSQVQIALPAVAPSLPPLPPLPPTPPPPPPEPPLTTKNTSNTSVNKDTSAPPVRPMLTSSHHLASTFAGLSQAFKNRFASATTTEGAGTKDSVVMEGIATASEYTQKLAEKAQLQAAEASASAKAAPKAVHLKGSTRTVTPWAPAPLLCKRMNIRLPDISKTTAQLGAQSEGASSTDVVSQLLGANALANAPVLQFGRAPDSTSQEVQRELEEARLAEAAKLDVYQAPSVAKPDISVFKSIFEDSDSEKEEDEEESGEAERKQGRGVQAGAIEEALLQVRTNNEEEQLTEVSKTNLLEDPRFAKSAAVEATTMDAEESGPVRFVPSKLRTTLASRNTTGGMAAGGGANKSRGTVRARTSFEDPDEEEVGDIVLTRQVRPRLPITDSGAARSSKTPQNLKKAEHEGDEVEESEEETVFVAVGGASARAASQNTVSFGGAGLGSRARKGRTAMAGSLRERLLAQQREDEGGEGEGEGEGKKEREGRGQVERGERKEEGAGSSGVEVAVAATMRPIHTITAPQAPLDENLSLETKRTNVPASSVKPRVTAIQSVINTSAADDFLAGLSDTLLPAPVMPAVQTVDGRGADPALVSAPRANSRFGSLPNTTTVAATVTATALTEATSTYSREDSVDQSHHTSVTPAADYFVPLPPPPPPLPAQPAPPPAPAPHALPAQVQQARHNTSVGLLEMVAPPEARFESSIQRLQNSLLGTADSKPLKEHKSKKESKKAHKSHKLNKHKHKKDKKDRKKVKKDSKKSKKSRHDESSGSGSDSSGSSSDSD